MDLWYPPIVASWGEYMRRNGNARACYASAMAREDAGLSPSRAPKANTFSPADWDALKAYATEDVNA